jgi:hypothetical protein
VTAPARIIGRMSTLGSGLYLTVVGLLGLFVAIVITAAALRLNRRDA